MTQVLIVFNPVSGSGRQALVHEVADILQQQGCAVTLYPTQHAGDATHYLQHCEGTLDIVVAAGGDGTVNEVVNGLLERDNQSYRLAVIPAGTTNVLAMELGLGKHARQIADVILQGREKAVYPGRINGRRFLLMAGIGYDAWVVDNVSLALKKKTGKLAYVVSMIRQLGKFGRKTYQVEADGQSYQANSVVITNGRYYGGSFILSRSADLSRSDTQVLMIRAKNPLTFLLTLLGLPLGMMEKMPGITSVAAREVIVTDADALAGREPVQADGDSLTELPLTLKMEEQPLRMLVP